MVKEVAWALSEISSVTSAGKSWYEQRETRTSRRWKNEYCLQCSVENRNYDHAVVDVLADRAGCCRPVRATKFTAYRLQRSLLRDPAPLSLNSFLS